MLKGVIVLVPFPFTDLSGTKVRPCVVLSEQKDGEDCVVVFISSSQQKDPFDLAVRKTTMNGLKRDSVIRVGKIATLQKKIILGELGRLDSVTIKKIDAKLKRLFKI